MSTLWEKQIGLLFILAGVSWALHHIFGERQFDAAYLRLGPMQLVMVGLMLWLHGKYRRPVAIDRA